MFIDYVTLMLINMAGGLFILASFIWKDIDKENNQFWAPAFALPGMVAAICGFAMTFSWPLPKPYNVAFGETSILLGFLFLTAAWSLAKGWELLPLGIYAFFAGLTGVLVGVRIMNLGLTASPLISGLGFILTGSGGIFAAVVLLNRRRKWLRTYPNNPRRADIFRGNGASERIQERKNGKQKTDTGFRTNSGKRSSL